MTLFEQFRRRELLPIALITSLGALLRFSSLDARSFWEDEVRTVLLIRADFTEMVSGVARTEATPHLYFVLAWLWAKVFGDGEIGLRSLSALAGTLTIVVVYAAASHLLGRRVGLIAAALTAVSPVLIWHAQDARAYALLVLLTGLSLLFFVRLLQAPTGRDLAWWAAVSVLALATHYFAVFLVGPQALWLLATNVRDRRRILAVGAVGLSGLLLLPLAAHQRRGDTGSTSSGGPSPEVDASPTTGVEAIELLPLGRRLLQFVAQFLVGPQPDLQRTSVAVTALLVLASLALLARRARRSEHRAAAVALALGVVAVAAPLLLTVVGFDYFLARNVLPAWIPFAIVIAAGLGASRAGRIGTSVAGALCVLCVLIFLATATEPKFEREDWRGAARALGLVDGSRAILVTPDVGTEALEHYRPHLREMPDRGGWVREVFLIGLSPREHRLGETPQPPRPSTVAPPATGFEQVERREHEYFTVVRFRAKEAALLTPRELSDVGLDSNAAVFLEQPEASARPEP